MLNFSCLAADHNIAVPLVQSNVISPVKEMSPPLFLNFCKNSYVSYKLAFHGATSDTRTGGKCKTENQIELSKQGERTNTQTTNEETNQTKGTANTDKKSPSQFSKNT